VIVVPLTVLGNWLDEFKRFAPHLNVIPYMGEQAAREQLRTHIVDFINSLPKDQRKSDPKLNFHVFLTSYDLAIKDAEFLQRFNWKYLVVVSASSFFLFFTFL
jgi:SNF2 family DNA or RNA helicase